MRLGDAGGVGLICELNRWNCAVGVWREGCVRAGGGVGDVFDVGFLRVGVVEEHSYEWRERCWAGIKYIPTVLFAGMTELELQLSGTNRLELQSPPSHGKSTLHC